MANDSRTSIHDISLVADDDGDRRPGSLGIGVRVAGAENHDTRARGGAFGVDDVGESQGASQQPCQRGAHEIDGLDGDARCRQEARTPGVGGREAGQLSRSTASLATLDSEMNA